MNFLEFVFLAVTQSQAGFCCCFCGVVLISGSVHRFKSFNRFLVHSHQWDDDYYRWKYKQITITPSYRREKCWTMSNIKIRVCACVWSLCDAYLAFILTKQTESITMQMLFMNIRNPCFLHLINYIIASEISPETAQLYQSVYVLTSK